MVLKTIYIIDLQKKIEAINKDVLLFSLEYEINNSNDLTNLFISRIISSIIEDYKQHNNFFIFLYIDERFKSNILKNGDLIKYKKFFNLLEKKIKFSIISFEKSLAEYVEELTIREEKYEELMYSYRSFSEIFPKLYEIIKKFRYKKIDNEYIKKNENFIKLLMSI